MMKYEAPTGYLYYNGHTLARVIFVGENNNLKWALIDNKYAESINLEVDDGLGISYWDGLQQNGEREDYSYAFCNASYPVLNPQHPINANRVMYMFMGCTELINANNILVNITSENPNMMYACANCIKMTKAPLFNFINVPIVKTYTSMYAGCVLLEDAIIYWGDGTADPITQRNSCQNMFYRCERLKNIDFGKAETGSPLYLDLSYAKELTMESVLSLYNSLKTIDAEKAQTDGSIHDITISTETMNLIKSEAPDIINNFAQKGWNLIEKSRQ